MSEIPDAPLSIPQMNPGAFFKSHRSEAAAAIMGVVDSGFYILGSEVEKFEEEFAGRFHFGTAVGVANGTDALVLALRSLGVGPGDRVATVSHTAVATVAAIQIVGARPVLVEIVPDTYTISAESLARTLDTYDSIKAVIAVHLYGHPADMRRVLQVAKSHGIYVVEDCSQAHGAQLNDQFVGSMSDVATFSFYPTKNLGALGDGGIVVSDNAERARMVRMLRQYGWGRRFISEYPGINSRLDELQAAILRIRLPHLDADNRRRAEIAAAYDRELAETELILPRAEPGAIHVYHQYVVRHPERNQLQQQLRKRGIGTSVHYPMPVHLQPAYSSSCDIDPGGLKISESIVHEILSLPMYPELSDEAVNVVIGAVRDSLFAISGNTVF